MENVIEGSSVGGGHIPVDEEMSFMTYLVRGFIFPCGSLNFYKAAIKMKLFWAIIFFIIFGLVFSTVQTAISMMNIEKVGTFVIEALHNGDVPEMVIHNGVAEVYAEQPIWYEDDVRYIGADTTGQFTVKDLRTYDEGILLVRDTIYIWEDGRLRDLSLRDMNDVFGDPIYFDEQHVTDFWQSFSRIMGFLMFFGLWFWHAGIRMLYILIVALVLWGIISLSKNDVGFGLVFISGIFANVPVMYIKTVLSWMDVSFFLLYTILLLIIWGIVLVKLFKTSEAKVTPAIVSPPVQELLEQVDPPKSIDDKFEE